MFAPEHARWFHAAVSGGRFEICEATTRGVKAHEYWKYMTGDFDIKVRRLKADASVRSKLAYYAATNVNSHYGFLNLLSVGAFLKSGNAWQRLFIPSSGVICSQLYFEASMRVGYLLCNVPKDTVCPAHLSLSEHLSDVEIPWIKV
jgi:hypothetical protein